MQTDCAPVPAIDPASQVDALLARGCRGVTLDVFDTLLWRETLHPSDAFLLLAEAHGRHHYKLRIWAEKLASHVCRHLLGREPTLRDIYRAYPLSAQHELAIESRLCRANPFCLRLVRHLVERRVPVAAISDMYLDNGQIAHLLAQTGYPDIPVFSSASAHLTKYRDGRLFRHVWQHLGLGPAEVIHVGDNPQADIAMAKRLGAHTCQVVTPRDTLLQVCPHAPVNRRLQDANGSLHWGRLAIQLQLHMGSDEGKLKSSDDRLSSILAMKDVQRAISQYMSLESPETLPPAPGA